MRPKLLRSFLFLFLLAANSLPAERCAGNLAVDFDGPDDELYAIYCEDIDDDIHELTVHFTDIAHHSCDGVEGVFHFSPFVRVSELKNAAVTFSPVFSQVPLYIRQRALLI